jgi:hypothetical protein
VRKVATLLLLALFLFNGVGYYGVYFGLKYQAGRSLKAKLDAGTYGETDLLTVKVPFLLPYQGDGKGYERIDGEFELDGQFYNLVQHKVERDTLYVVYIKNHSHTSLFKSLVEFVQSTSDGPVSKNAHKLVESLVKDYIPTVSAMITEASGWCRLTPFAERHVVPLVSETRVPSPPPDKA